MDIKEAVTVVGVVIAAISLAFTAFSAWAGVRTNRARFWLDLRDRFGHHDEVHRKLRPGGSWANGGGPATSEEWAMVEAYMGLFEHCEIMLEQGLIDDRTFREIYLYRLRNIVANDIIRQQKLIDRASGWPRFLALLKRVNVDLPKEAASRK